MLSSVREFSEADHVFLSTKLQSTSYIYTMQDVKWKYMCRVHNGMPLKHCHPYNQTRLSSMEDEVASMKARSKAFGGLLSSLSQGHISWLGSED